MHIYKNLTIKRYHGNTVQYPSQYVYPSLFIVVPSSLPRIHRSLYHLVIFLAFFNTNTMMQNVMLWMQPEEDVTKSIVDVAELQLPGYCFDNFWYLNVLMMFLDSVDEY